MEVVKDQKTKKMVQYGKRIWNLEGSDNEIIEKAIAATYNFFASLGAKMTLKEWNISDEYFPVMVERLVERGIGEIPLTTEQIENILDSCLE